MCVCFCVCSSYGCRNLSSYRQRRKEGKQVREFLDLSAGPPKMQCLQVEMRCVCVCVTVSPGRHFLARNMCGIVGIAGTGKLDAGLFGVTPALDLALCSVRLLEATVMIERRQSLMLGQGRCHRCEMAL